VRRYLGWRSDHPGRAAADMPHQGVVGHRLPWVRQSADAVFADARQRIGGRLALAAVVLLVWAYLAWTYGRVTGRRIRSWQHWRWAPLVTLCLVSTWFVVRNIPFAPFNWLYV
jgi:hypothetical protein